MHVEILSPCHWIIEKGDIAHKSINRYAADHGGGRETKMVGSFCCHGVGSHCFRSHEASQPAPPSI
jgi:hypothetical protein